MADPVSPVRAGRRQAWWVVIPLVFACLTLACGAAGVLGTGLSAEHDLLPEEAAPWVGIPMALTGIIGTAVGLELAASLVWLWLPKRGQRVLLAVGLTAVGVLSVGGIAAAIALISTGRLPESLVLETLALLLILFLLSLALNLFFGPLLLVISLIAKPRAPSAALAGTQPAAGRPGSAESVCPACGAENPADHAFCDRCGATL